MMLSMTRFVIREDKLNSILGFLGIKKQGLIFRSCFYNNMQNRTTTILLTSICFFAFLIFGVTDNLKGPTLPAMLAELNIDYSTGGNISFSEYVGFLIANLITGILADRFGLKLVFVLAGVALVIGAGGYSYFGTPLLLSISLFIVGLSMSLFTGRSALWSACRMLVIGCFAGGVTYGLGLWFGVSVS